MLYIIRYRKKLKKYNFKFIDKGIQFNLAKLMVYVTFNNKFYSVRGILDIKGKEKILQA